MLHDWGVIAAAFGYIGFLFLVASYGDRLSPTQRGRASALIYPLSLAIYCTSWTFFGSVGFATRTGIDFLAIYVGPILMIAFCTPLLRRVIKLAKSQNITSIADFIAARYGKSQAVAATVAAIAIIGSVPYIALQLKAVASSLGTILSEDQAFSSIPIIGDVALIVTLAMAVFAVLFGTRQTDATEHQHGLMLAVATESIVKLVAFIAVGAFVTFWMFSPGRTDRTRDEDPGSGAGHRVHALDRQFPDHDAAVVLRDHAAAAPVSRQRGGEFQRRRGGPGALAVSAVSGRHQFVRDSDRDRRARDLPVRRRRKPTCMCWRCRCRRNSTVLSVIVFVGGLSAATAMVIVECVALSIMVSNDIVVPLVLQRSRETRAGQKDFGNFLLRVRRFAIFAIMVMAYFYYRALGNAQLAAIGLLSFAAIAQLAPSFFGGLFWRRATARGAMGGMLVGVAVWIYTLFLPSFLDGNTAGMLLLQHGPFGIEALRPRALFGADLPPLLHGVLWSLSLNLLTYIVLSLARQPSSIERLQADLFAPSALAPMTPAFRRWRTTVTVQDMQSTVAQYLGPDRARHSFEAFAIARNTALDPAAPADFELLQHAEHLIASSIGAASSRLVMSLLLRKRTVSAKAALKLLDDSHAALHFNREVLQTALNHVRQGIAVFDEELQLICSNRQFGEILGLPLHLVQIGIPLREILEFMGATSPPGLGESDGAALLDMRLAAYTTEGEPYLERLPDRHMVIEVRANRMPGGGLVITFSDVTPSFEAAEALERANATLEKRVRDRTEELTRLNSELALAKSTAEDANISKTRFLAAASHDILQPLNAARLYVTSLVERQNGGEDSRLVENIDDSLEAIEEILGALLDISRLDAGAMTPSISSFKIGDLMRSLEIEFAPIARAKALKLTFVPSSLAVESDRLMLRRLLQNLISNAIKYTPRGRVLVGCRRHGQSLQIGVYDTGVGIPVVKRGEIFKEFHRLEQGARIARGLGLGLSIVERLARVLNHGIALDSNVSGGSFFSVTVPVASAVTHTGAVTSATPLSQDADERLADRVHRERSGDPGRHEDPADGLGRRGHRGGRSRCRHRGDRGRRRAGHRPAGRLSSRPRQRRRRDPGHPPPVRRKHSGDPDHRGPQSACAGRGARREHRGAQQAGQAGKLRALLGQWRTQQMVAAE